MTKQEWKTWVYNEIANYSTSRSRAEHVADQQRDERERVKQNKEKYGTTKRISPF